MIEFNGKLVGEANVFFQKNFKKTIIKLWLIMFILPLPGTISVSKMFDTNVIFLIHAIFSFILPLVLRFRNGRKIVVTEKVYIGMDDNIVYKCGKILGSGKISNVKKVVDYGDFFYIQFPYQYLTSEVVCQKSNLAKGSVDEFEELFKDKLVRHKM